MVSVSFPVIILTFATLLILLVQSRSICVNQLLVPRRVTTVFFNRAVDCWNCLPETLLHCDSLHSFKNHLDKLDLSAYCYVHD